jgi:hypothetical protein
LPAVAAHDLQPSVQKSQVLSDHTNGDDQVTTAEGRHVRPGVVDHTDELVTDALAFFGGASTGRATGHRPQIQERVTRAVA